MEAKVLLHNFLPSFILSLFFIFLKRLYIP
jgi:hypothetical protein